MKINTPLKFAILICLIISFFVILYSYLSTLFNPIIVGSALFIIYFSATYYLLKYQFYEKVKIIYKNIYKFKGTSNISDLNLENANIQAEQWADQKEEELIKMKENENYRREFIGNVSHELKTPLFTVQGYILTLLDGAYKDKAVLKKYLKRANKGVERLIYIIKDLDMITQLEVGGLVLEKENFNIIKLVKNIFDLLEMKASVKNISLVFDKHYKESIKVNGDQERIQQVLSNLIVNSIKYGKKEGTTEISVEHLVKDKVIIRVTDNGEGIENEHLPRIFERFYRVDKSGSRKEGGSGLGLSIVKHIMDAHQENIYVESQHGIGSEFSFTMQLSN